MADLAGSGEDERAEALIAQYLDVSDGQAALAALGALGRARVGLSHLWDATEHRIARFRATGFTAMASFRPKDGRGGEPFVVRGLADDNPYVVAAAARGGCGSRSDGVALTIALSLALFVWSLAELGADLAGNLAQWTAALGTVAAFAATLVLLRQGQEVQRRDVEERERRQASLVLDRAGATAQRSWLSRGVHRQTGAKKTVYDVVLSVVGDKGGEHYFPTLGTRPTLLCPRASPSGAWARERDRLGLPTT